MGRQLVEQPRGKPREPVAMIHLRAVRDFARVDHGFFLPLVSGTLVSKHPSPKSVTIRKNIGSVVYADRRNHDFLPEGR